MSIAKFFELLRAISQRCKAASMEVQAAQSLAKEGEYCDPAQAPNPLILCIISRPCPNHHHSAVRTGRSDMHIRHLVDEAREEGTLLELHNLDRQATDDYATGSLWVHATAIAAEARAGKQQAGRSNSSTDAAVADDQYGVVPKTLLERQGECLRCLARSR